MSTPGWALGKVPGTHTAPQPACPWCPAVPWPPAWRHASSGCSVTMGGARSLSAWRGGRRGSLRRSSEKHRLLGDPAELGECRERAFPGPCRAEPPEDPGPVVGSAGPGLWEGRGPRAERPPPPAVREGGPGSRRGPWFGSLGPSLPHSPCVISFKASRWLGTEWPLGLYNILLHPVALQALGWRE